MFSIGVIGRVRRRIRIGQSGVAAVEMAIVFPLFLAVSLGILAFGLYFGAAHSTQQLAADAARASIAGLDTNERVAIVTRYVASNASQYPLVIPEFVKAKAGPSSSNPDDFVVTVSFDASSLPIWGLAQFVPLPSELIERTAVVHRGGMQ